MIVLLILFWTVSFLILHSFFKSKSNEMRRLALKLVNQKVKKEKTTIFWIIKKFLNLVSLYITSPFLLYPIWLLIFLSKHNTNEFIKMFVFVDMKIMYGTYDQLNESHREELENELFYIHSRFPRFW